MQVLWQPLVVVFVTRTSSYKDNKAQGECGQRKANGDNKIMHDLWGPYLFAIHQQHEKGQYVKEIIPAKHEHVGKN